MWERATTTNFEVEPSLANTGSFDNPEEGAVSLGTDIVSGSQMDSPVAKLQTEMMMLGLMDKIAKGFRTKGWQVKRANSEDSREEEGDF